MAVPGAQGPRPPRTHDKGGIPMPQNRTDARALAAPSADLTIEHVEVASLHAHPQNPRAHPAKQIKRIAQSIRTFGFRMPVIIDADSRLICGHARVQACKQIGIERVPAVRVTDLDDAKLRALMIADNRLTEASEWDERLLGENLKILADLDLDFDLECIGFDYGEIEHRITSFEEADGQSDDEADEFDPAAVPVVTEPGDLWVLGDRHRVLCADSTRRGSYEQLLGTDRAAMVFTDPPYNLPARTIGRVCEHRHGAFAMGAGEMSPDEFTGFLTTVMEQLREFSEPGSIHYHFMDWRHAGEILHAGGRVYDELKNVCVWVKDRPGMGTFYRSQHEMVFVFKSGTGKHRNHFELGQHGRTRSNVWHFPSAMSMRAEDGDPSRGDVLSMHPTVKPVRLIGEALLDCSRRGEIVLDPFLGSGSTLIACERANRRCVGLELEPRYVDVALGRWRELTGEEPVHGITGMTFAQLASEGGR